MGWEYLVRFHFLRFEDQEKDKADLQSYLSDMGMGEEGWELASLTLIPIEDRKKYRNDVNSIFVFKRPHKA